MNRLIFNLMALSGLAIGAMPQAASADLLCSSNPTSLPVNPKNGSLTTALGWGGGVEDALKSCNEISAPKEIPECSGKSCPSGCESPITRTCLVRTFPGQSDADALTNSAPAPRSTSPLEAKEIQKLAAANDISVENATKLFGDLQHIMGSRSVFPCTHGKQMCDELKKHPLPKTCAELRKRLAKEQSTWTEKNSVKLGVMDDNDNLVIQGPGIRPIVKKKGGDPIAIARVNPQTNKLEALIPSYAAWDSVFCPSPKKGLINIVTEDIKCDDKDNLLAPPAMRYVAQCIDRPESNPDHMVSVRIKWEKNCLGCQIERSAETHK